MYYLSREVEQLDDNFKCMDCPIIMLSPAKRFKILVLVEDEAEKCNFILLDRATKRIVGSTASIIVTEMNKVELEGGSVELEGLPHKLAGYCGKRVPQKLQDIVGKECTFTLL